MDLDYLREVRDERISPAHIMSPTSAEAASPPERVPSFRSMHNLRGRGATSSADHNQIEKKWDADDDVWPPAAASSSMRRQHRSSNDVRQAGNRGRRYSLEGRGMNNRNKQNGNQHQHQHSSGGPFRFRSLNNKLKSTEADSGNNNNSRSSHDSQGRFKQILLERLQEENGALQDGKLAKSHGAYPVKEQQGVGEGNSNSAGLGVDQRSHSSPVVGASLHHQRQTAVINESFFHRISSLCNVSGRSSGRASGRSGPMISIRHHSKTSTISELSVPSQLPTESQTLRRDMAMDDFINCTREQIKCITLNAANREAIQRAPGIKQAWQPPVLRRSVAKRSDDMNNNIDKLLQDIDTDRSFLMRFQKMRQRIPEEPATTKKERDFPPTTWSSARENFGKHCNEDWGAPETSKQTRFGKQAGSDAMELAVATRALPHEDSEPSQGTVPQATVDEIIKLKLQIANQQSLIDAQATKVHNLEVNVRELKEENIRMMQQLHVYKEQEEESLQQSPRSVHHSSGDQMPGTTPEIGESSHNYNDSEHATMDPLDVSEKLEILRDHDDGLLRVQNEAPSVKKEDLPHKNIGESSHNNDDSDRATMDPLDVSEKVNVQRDDEIRLLRAQNEALTKENEGLARENFKLTVTNSKLDARLNDLQLGTIASQINGRGDTFRQPPQDERYEDLEYLRDKNHKLKKENLKFYCELELMKKSMGDLQSHCSGCSSPQSCQLTKHSSMIQLKKAEVPRTSSFGWF